jgi:hypothetical protein
MTDTLPVPVGVAAIRMQLDRKDQPHAFYQVRCELDGSSHSGWKRWSECRQFAYAVALQTIDAPKFPSHKFISVVNSNAARLVSNRCLDPDYLERRRLSLELFFKACYAKCPVAVARFLDAGKGPETEGGVLNAMYPPTPHAPTPRQRLREPRDPSDRFSRAEETAAAMTEDRARRNTERKAAARRALPYDAPAAAPATARRRASPEGGRAGPRRVSFSREAGGRGPTSTLCLLGAALLGGLLSVALGWAAAPPEPAVAAGSWAALWSSASARLVRLACARSWHGRRWPRGGGESPALPSAPRPPAPRARGRGPPRPSRARTPTQVCAVMQNSSEVAQCSKLEAVGSLDAAALEACAVRACQASDALLLPRRWLAVEPTPATLVLVYVMLTVAALAPRKWLPW